MFDEEKLDRVLSGVGSARPKAVTTQNSAILRALDDFEDVADVEGLLAWSSELDYDAYLSNWHVLATSGTSGSDFHEPVNGKGRRYYNGASMGPAATNDSNSLPDDVPEPDWATLNRQIQTPQHHHGSP